MAQRRMLSLKVIDTDDFLDMPMTSQYLYYNLSMRADDDGFISNPKKIMRMVGCNDDDLKVLSTKKFIIPFDSGVCVIRHWRIHNLIRSDRYSTTEYKDEMSQLEETHGKYCLKQDVIPNGNQLSYQMEPQVRLGKDRLGKVKLGKDNINNISKEIVAEPQLKEITLLINDCISKLEECIENKLDGTKVENRKHCAMVIKNKIKPLFRRKYDREPTREETVNFIEMFYSIANSFEKGKITNFKYIYYNFAKIINSQEKAKFVTI